MVLVDVPMRNVAGTGVTMIMVTHEMRLVKYVSKRVLYLDKEGIIEDCPSSQIFDNPKDERTRRFLYSIKNLFDARSDFLTTS